MKSKKGVSIIIGYVLLIVVAISLSLMVYTWLKGLLPGKAKECPDSVSLIISDYKCENKNITLSLKNHGLFNLYGFTARASNSSEGFFYELEGERGEKMHYFAEINNPVLKPNEEAIKSFSYAKHGKIERINIEPFMLNDKKEVVFCGKAVIIQNLENCE